MSLSNEEIIKRLRAAGVTAVECPNCGRVKEVQNGVVVFHYVPSTEIICEGSNLDPLGSVEDRLKEIEQAEFAEAPCGPQCADDYLNLAAEAAKENLTFLFEQIESAAAQAAKALPEDVPVFVTVTSENGEQFCGCVTCLVREVLLTVWPFALQAEASEIVNYLQRESSREGLTAPVRKACQHIAAQIAEHHYDGYKDA